MPRLPFVLNRGGESLLVAGLVDTGASVNVLPFDVGLALGATWEEDGRNLQLAGNLGEQDARPLQLEATFPRETTLKSRVPLIFAWSKDQNAPLLLGQFNFFENFDVCFYRSKNYFEVQPNDSH